MEKITQINETIDLVENDGIKTLREWTPSNISEMQLQTALKDVIIRIGTNKSEANDLEKEKLEIETKLNLLK